MQEKDWRLKVNSPYFQTVPPELFSILDEMWMELWENPSKSEKVISDKSGTLIRVATSVTPPWYQELCRLYPDSRGKGPLKKKPRTIIKRKNILGTLECMVTRGFTWSRYGEYLLSVARSLESKLKEDQEYITPWNNQF